MLQTSHKNLRFKSCVSISCLPVVRICTQKWQIIALNRSCQILVRIGTIVNSKHLPVIVVFLSIEMKHTTSQWKPRLLSLISLKDLLAGSYCYPPINNRYINLICSLWVILLSMTHSQTCRIGECSVLSPAPNKNRLNCKIRHTFKILSCPWLP